jgi:hypothetical protein
MWLEGLPADFAPSWHAEQGSLIAEWSKLAGFHAVVEWQPPHSATVTIWLSTFPVAILPSWQELQVPSTLA